LFLIVHSIDHDQPDVGEMTLEELREEVARMRATQIVSSIMK
jgi:hypothetical protein